MTFALTPAAERFIRRMLRLDGAGGQFRLAVTQGGCSGLAAEFGVESEPRPGDKAVDVGGIPSLLPAESRLLLDGVTIDFVDTATETGFVFHDPKGGTCGCAGSDAAPAGDVEPV